MHYPSVASNIRHIKLSEVTKADIANAVQKIKEKENAEFPIWLASWSPWKNLVQRYNKERVEQLYDLTAIEQKISTRLKTERLEGDDDALRQAGLQVMADIDYEIAQEYIEHQDLADFLAPIWPDEYKITNPEYRPTIVTAV